MEKKEEYKNDDLDEFKLILERSETIDKIKNINNPVKKFDYNYSSEADYSDDISYYLAQTIDKINQCKYISSLNNSNPNNNFKIYNINYTTDIDAYSQYESKKLEVYYNKKAFNVHEHRKIPYEEENRQFHRQRYNNDNNFFHNNRNQKYNNYNNKRNLSVDINNRFRNKENNNEDKVKVGGIPEFRNHNDNNLYSNRENRVSKDDRNNSLDKINIKETIINKRIYSNNDGLTSYNPFHKPEKKYYKEDEEEQY